MKKNLWMSAFSLMEMMIVLLIVAIIAAASAPMISKKMMRQTGTGDSPWVFTGTDNNVVFNAAGNHDDVVFIGTPGLPTGPTAAVPNPWNNGDNYRSGDTTRVDHAPMVIRSSDVPSGSPAPCIAFADDRNRLMGYLGMSRRTTYFSNVIPTEDFQNGDDGAVVIGTDISASGVNRVNGVTQPGSVPQLIRNKIIVGNQINYDCRSDANWRNHDILFGQNLDIVAADSNNPLRQIINYMHANVIVGSNISNAGNPLQRSSSFNTVAVGNGITLGRANSPVEDGVAIGSDTSIVGTGAIAIGDRTEATADRAVAIGSHAFADRNVIAIGHNAQRSGNGDNDNGIPNADNSISIGNNAQSRGGNSISIGLMSRNDHSNAIAIGNHAFTNGDNAIAIGSATNVAGNNATLALQDDAIAIGPHAVAQLQNSVAIGLNAVAQHGNSVAIGVGALTTDTSQIMLGTPAQTVRIPGDISLSETARDNLKNQLGVSDIRLKNVGEKFTSGLEEIKKLEFFNYTFKNDKEQKPHVGVMAQDLQKVFPISVTEGADGYLRIRKDEMFYAALNAIKELDNIITEIKNKVIAYFNRVEKLEAQIAEQQKTIEELKAQNAEFKKRLAKIEKKGVNKGVNKGVKKEVNSSINKLSESEAE